ESWGLPLNEADRQNAGILRDRLAAQDIHLPAGNPLVAIYPFSSSFVYRRRVNGQEQKVKVTRIPSVADIDTELQKAEDAQLVEEARRDVAAGKSAGVVLLNQALVIDGRLEVGPLLRNRGGQVLGVGLIQGQRALQDFFGLIERLPVTDRARLRFNHFAATVVNLDTDGDRFSERDFLCLWQGKLGSEKESLVDAIVIRVKSDDVGGDRMDCADQQIRARNVRA